MTIVVRSSEIFPKEFRGCSIALGNFDGVHLGHAELIKNAVQSAREKGIPKGVVTFYPHPLTVINPELQFQYLVPFKDRIKRLAAYNLDFIYVIEFSEKYRNLLASEFVTEELVKKLSPKKMVIGFNFRFGKGKEGDGHMLSKLAAQHNCELQEVTPIKFMGYQVSTSLIKRMLMQGRVILANRMLNIPINYESKVESLDSKHIRGHDYLVVQLELEIDVAIALPMSGCYFTRVRVQEKELFALVDFVQEGQLSMLIQNDEAISISQNIALEPMCLMHPKRVLTDPAKLEAHLNRDVASMNFMLKNVESIDKTYQFL